MDADRTARAKGAFDSLYHWIFSTPSSASSSLATRAASSVASVFDNSDHGEKVSTHYDNLYDYNIYLQQQQRPAPQHFWDHWSLGATLDNLLWDYTPDICALQQRFGLQALSETYNIEQHIIVWVIALLVFLVVSVTCVILGASHLGEDTLQPDHGVKATVSLKSSMDHKTGVRSVEATPSRKKRHRKGGKGKGYLADTTTSKPSRTKSSEMIQHGQDLSSWSMMLGSSGFYSGQMMAYTPVDIHAHTEEKPLSTTGNESEQNTWSSILASMKLVGKRALDYTFYKNPAGHDLTPAVATVDLPEASPAHVDASLVSDPLTSKAFDSPENDSLDTTSVKPPYEGDEQQDVNDNNTITPDSSLPAESTADEYATMSMARNAARALRTRSKHFISSSRHARSQHKVGKLEDHAKIGRDLGSRITGYASHSQLLKDMNSISGGVLGTAVATVAALATTAEITAGAIKDKLPDSVTDFTQELKESFDYAMESTPQQDRDSADDGESWAIRQAVSQIIKDDSKAADSYKTSTSKKSSIQHLSIDHGANTDMATPPTTEVQDSPAINTLPAMMEEEDDIVNDHLDFVGGDSAMPQEQEDEEKKDEEMKDEEMKDEELKDERKKDEEMKDERKKDEEMKDEEIKDEGEKDEEKKDEERKDEKKDEEKKDEEETVVATMSEGDNYSENSSVNVNDNSLRPQAHPVTDESLSGLDAAWKGTGPKRDAHPCVQVIGFMPAPARPAPATIAPVLTAEVTTVTGDSMDEDAISVGGSSPTTNSKQQQHHHNQHRVNHWQRHQHQHHSSRGAPKVHPHDEIDTENRDLHTSTTVSATGDKINDAEEEHAQEYTLDEHGNKVAVAEVRRDSGFDMLA